MAEDLQFQPSHDAFQVSHKPSQTLQQDPSSVIDLILDKPQQSPNKLVLDGSNESSSLDGVDQVSEVSDDVLMSSVLVVSNNDVCFDAKDDVNETVRPSCAEVDTSLTEGTTSITMELIDETVRRKVKYSIKELEKLRYGHGKYQKKFWKNVYNRFDDNVRKDYDELVSFRQNKQKGKRKCSDQGTVGDSALENVAHDVYLKDSTHVTFDGEDGDKYSEDLVEWSEEEQSDDEYHSIQRPAFKVEGKPNFESGPPEDGIEYLRRVRWEASHIPKVKVVKLDKTIVTEQSVYMPKIPDIEKCPSHLIPSRQWEDEFIADFSELRMAISILVDTSDAVSSDPDTIIFSRPECTKRTSKSPAPVELPAGGPTLSTLVAMEPVTRVGLLNKRISLFEKASNLSKDDCAWLFALCAVVETPFDADSSASLRCLLRRCAKLRAEKDEFDEEVVMLNILVTIAGKVFGQSEN